MSKGVKVCAMYSVVTPMFLSGADQSKPELRVSSIRGALRFWWRALAWNRLKGNLRKIREEESLLFGSTSHGQGMLMRLLNPKDLRSFVEKHNDDANMYWNEQKARGLKYISYGLDEDCRRGAFASLSHERSDDVRFGIECRLKSSIAEGGEYDRVEMLKSALIALGTFGGLGAKSRKGFGSLNINMLDKVRITNDMSTRCKRLFPDKPCPCLPTYTAFSGYSDGECSCRVVDLLKVVEKSPDAALAKIGQAISKKSNELSKSDSGHIRNPQALVFGLPRKRKDGLVKPRKTERRGSPILFHVYRKGKNFGVIAVVLPAKFLPDDGLVIVNEDGTAPTNVDEQVSWSAVNGLLRSLSRDMQEIYPAPEANHE